MNQAFHLHRLQQIDTQIDQSTASLAEIERLLAGDEGVRQARKEVEDAGKALHQARHTLSQLEFRVKEQQIKIAQSESALYGGKVRNPKELQDLQKEIFSLKKYLSQLEDQQLESMLAVEEAENCEQAAKNALVQAQATFTEQSAGWLGQKETLIRNLDRLHAERGTAVSPVSETDLKTYESIRKRKSGVAVTSVREGSCSVCGASIRPAELQSARSAIDLVFCSTCGRILYTG